MTNPTKPSARPMDRVMDMVIAKVMDKAMDKDKAKAKQFFERIVGDKRKVFVHSSGGFLVVCGNSNSNLGIDGSTSRIISAEKSDDNDTTISTQGCISEKFSICHGTRTPYPAAAAAATTMSNDPNYGGATKHDNILLELEILDDDALELILNELKREIRNFRGRTRNGNIIILDDKRRPEEGEIKYIWRLFKVFKMLKIKRREDNYVKKADTAHSQVGNNSNSMHKKKEKRKKPPAVNDFNCSDKDIKFQFVKLKEQIVDIHRQMFQFVELKEQIVDIHRQIQEKKTVAKLR